IGILRHRYATECYVNLAFRFYQVSSRSRQGSPRSGFSRLDWGRQLRDHGRAAADAIKNENYRGSVIEAIERRFVWQARIATVLVAASGIYIVAELELWDRFLSIRSWWMHAMVLVWLIF